VSEKVTGERENFLRTMLSAPWLSALVIIQWGSWGTVDKSLRKELNLKSSIGNEFKNNWS